MANPTVVLSVDDTLWADECGVCPEWMSFDNSTSCARLSLEDKRCFRGEFGPENDWFTYDFELPPEWNVPVTFNYTATYWSLGKWKDEKKSSKEVAGSFYCDGAAIDLKGDCTTDLGQSRPDENFCTSNKWMTWNSDSSYNDTFDPYFEWPATQGSDWDTPCYWKESFAHQWSQSTLKVGFRVYDDKKKTFGLSGDSRRNRSAVAWALSDFRIQFTPAPPTTTRIYTTSTTSLPTTTTTTLPTTTAFQKTTATSTSILPTADTSKTTADASNKTTWIMFGSTTTATEESSGGSGSNGFLGGNVLYAAVGAVVFCMALCRLALGFWSRRKKGAQPKDESDVVNIVFSVSGKPEVEMIAMHPEYGLSPTEQQPDDTRMANGSAVFGSDDDSDRPQHYTYDSGDDSSDVAPLYEPGPGFSPTEVVIILDVPKSAAEFTSFKSLLIQLKADACTAEKKATAKKLDMALTLAPVKMEKEFQCCVQMGADLASIGDYLLGVADNIMDASGKKGTGTGVRPAKGPPPVPRVAAKVTPGAPMDSEWKPTDEVADDELEDEMMYMSMPSNRTLGM